MSCDYCENEADYMFQNGERICKTCLTELPTNTREANLIIVQLKKENKKLKMIIDEGLGPKDLNSNF